MRKVSNGATKRWEVEDIAYNLYYQNFRKWKCHEPKGKKPVETKTYHLNLVILKLILVPSIIVLMNKSSSNTVLT